ncbi:ATP-binding protein [Halalkalibacter nanhaiisediminis]|uniref:histidine kinase n=1 Tax=Halalkalibacter nanhaiisediminis TaxID=688079 RepID=A0A562QSX8_9BACI|nr:ATP-binding protein [Halalkalibacter nanhaiisediminis]TWI59852.1 PAS domain S-box-containing protein [Halalkalibacter nanhaiisediminis]
MNNHKRSLKEFKQPPSSIVESIIHHTVDATAVIDNEFNLLKVNKAFEQLFGWTEQEVMDGKFSLFADLKQEFEHSYLTTYETAKQHKNGSLLDLSLIISPIFHPKGHIILRTCTIKNITESKRREAELIERERQLQVLINKIPDTIDFHFLPEKVMENERQIHTVMNSIPYIIYFKDSESRWIEANDLGISIFQLEDVPYKGMVNADLYALNDFFRDPLQNCEKTDLQAWESKKPVRYEQIIPQLNSQPKIFDIVKVPLFHPNGERRSIVIMGRDITEFKKTEELLRKTEKLHVIGQLAAGVAHEIRNPLTTIRGFLQLSKEGGLKPEYIDTMLLELKQIEEMSNEFITLAKPTLTFKLNDPLMLLEQVKKFFTTSATLNNIQIVTKFNVNTPFIYCDERQLKKAFVNVIKNAIEAGPAGSKITIQVQLESSKDVLIRIIDQGSGIPHERLKKLGEPFYSNKEKGIGLGLTVCYKIVEAHQGSIQINSQKGMGTTVDILLPTFYQDNRYDQY